MFTRHFKIWYVYKTYNIATCLRYLFYNQMIKLRNTINKMYKSKTRTNLLLPSELTTTKQKQKTKNKNQKKSIQKVWGKLNLNPFACDVHLRKCKIRLQKNTLTNDYSLRLLMKIKILGKPYTRHDKK